MREETGEHAQLGLTIHPHRGGLGRPTPPLKEKFPTPPTRPGEKLGGKWGQTFLTRNSVVGSVLINKSFSRIQGRIYNNKTGTTHEVRGLHKLKTEELNTE